MKIFLEVRTSVSLYQWAAADISLNPRVYNKVAIIGALEEIFDNSNKMASTPARIEQFERLISAKKEYTQEEWQADFFN